jgi:acyl carrier protein
MAISNRDEIEAIVLDCITRLNVLREGDSKLATAVDSPLFGDGSPLDSMGLVTLTMDVEDALADQGVEVSLSDSRAMSRKQSPFRTVATLVQFIEEQMGEA